MGGHIFQIVEHDYDTFLFYFYLIIALYTWRDVCGYVIPSVDVSCCNFMMN